MFLYAKIIISIHTSKKGSQGISSNFFNPYFSVNFSRKLACNIRNINMYTFWSRCWAKMSSSHFFFFRPHIFPRCISGESSPAGQKKSVLPRRNYVGGSSSLSLSLSRLLFLLLSCVFGDECQESRAALLSTWTVLFSTQWEKRRLKLKIYFKILELRRFIVGTSKKHVKDRLEFFFLYHLT